jgi:hypothetical protein
MKAAIGYLSVSTSEQGRSAFDARVTRRMNAPPQVTFGHEQTLDVTAWPAISGHWEPGRGRTRISCV